MDSGSGGSNSTFCKLKIEELLELVSEKEGSPLVCVNGKKEKHFSRCFLVKRINKELEKGKVPIQVQVSGSLG